MDSEWFEKIEKEQTSTNDLLKAIALNIDENIHQNYKLWPANYIALDLLNNNDVYSSHYSIKEKRQFERRLSRRIDVKNALEVNSYLLMYANPVINLEVLNENKI